MPSVGAHEDDGDAPCSSSAPAVSTETGSTAPEPCTRAQSVGPFSGFRIVSVGEKLGAGAYGEVFAVEILMDDGSTSDAVMKVLYDPSQVADHEREVAALEAVRDCPYVVQMYGSGRRDGHLCTVMERAKGVPLKELLDEAGNARGRRSRTVLPYPQIARLARQLLTAVEAMAARGLLHGDLKPANIMYDQGTGDITIVDLGCGSFQGPDGLSHHAGTPGFMSLEMEAALYDRPCEYRPCLQSDVAAVGCILCAATAFADRTGMVVSVRDYQDPLPSYAPPHLQQLIYGCLEADPARRLTPTAALAEPFLARFPGSS
ncbi:hypothetical protein HYH03_016013 [Edaphochlamys debaryana]|uniref:NEK6-subfamily protein kinase n=1 Tax=Edaphochlamys debaryana TaxID=47281 RepID=A0A835XL30_9CHLO|nr:hypothetical protein HYH03_016013 [Edaphochlamys debaryana]|eukprot:KAG2485227.1 hypothetical protein HYH03_016013 [Edaphochlamys debaryana]